MENKTRVLRAKGKTVKRQRKFRRQEWWASVGLADRWKKPRGHRSKLRLSRKARGKKPNVGFGTPHSLKGLGKSGLYEIRVTNLGQLKTLDPKKSALILSATLGRKKKADIVKSAEEKGFTITNL